MISRVYQLSGCSDPFNMPGGSEELGRAESVSPCGLGSY